MPINPGRAKVDLKPVSSRNYIKKSKVDNVDQYKNKVKQGLMNYTAVNVTPKKKINENEQIYDNLMNI